MVELYLHSPILLHGVMFNVAFPSSMYLRLLLLLLVVVVVVVVVVVFTASVV
jgi:hypothetical protein